MNFIAIYDNNVRDNIGNAAKCGYTILTINMRDGN